MSKQIFPEAFLQNSVEAYLPTVSVRGQLVYMSVLLAIVAVMAASPFIMIDVSVQSNGTIRPVSERTNVKPLVAGTVLKIAVVENEAVKVGDTLALLATEILEAKSLSISSERSQLRLQTFDLQQLIDISNHAPNPDVNLKSQLYVQQYAQYLALINEIDNRLHQSERDLKLYRLLDKDKVTAPIELQDKKYAYERVSREKALAYEQQLSRWQADLNQLRLRLNEISAQQRQIDKEKNLYVLKAPVSGTIQQINGHYEGAYMQAGEILCAISPDSSLLVECYVNPSDIGLLKKEMAAKFQIQAFNYNEWGLATGKIKTIANDFVVVNNQPIFSVKCGLDKSFLSLKNGYKGYFKKGMNVNARFTVARRSIFQLLYDKVDNWVNPKVK